jgi:hypothetical protein
LRVELLDHVAKLSGKCQLVILDPLFEHLYLPLLEDWASELNGLNLVQLGAFQES